MLYLHSYQGDSDTLTTLVDVAFCLRTLYLWPEAVLPPSDRKSIETLSSYHSANNINHSSELTLVWTPEKRPPLYSGHFEMWPCTNSPLKWGHPLIRTLWLTEVVPPWNQIKNLILQIVLLWTAPHWWPTCNHSADYVATYIHLSYTPPWNQLKNCKSHFANCPVLWTPHWWPTCNHSADIRMYTLYVLRILYIS